MTYYANFIRNYNKPMLIQKEKTLKCQLRLYTLFKGNRSASYFEFFISLARNVNNTLSLYKVVEKPVKKEKTITVE